MLSRRKTTLLCLSLLVFTQVACLSTPPPTLHDLDGIAAEYVVLTLALGEHDKDFVDAYHGPQKLRAEAKRARYTPEAISIKAALLDSALDAGNFGDDSEQVALRRKLLSKQLRAVRTRADQVRGKTFSFNEEASLLYDVTPPVLSQQHFDALLARLDALLPGEGSVSQRRNNYRSQFVIPPDKLDAVFSEAIEECKRRTVARIALPENERFEVEYVNDKPWSGYNWFQGDAYSLIQVNTDLPIHIDRAVDLACHEGYPGHHVFNTLLEQELVGKRGWIEYSVYPLFSPMSLIAEGSANYGIEMAFPGQERQQYERDVLFPLAGLDSSAVDVYYEIEQLAGRLNHAGNEAARRYLDGEIDAAAAQQWLQDYALMTPARAEQRVRFIERYRSYVINYNLGQDIVRDYIERAGPEPEARWQRFTELLSVPLPASMLR